MLTCFDVILKSKIQL